jgi:ATP-dependent helicase HrpB
MRLELAQKLWPQLIWPDSLQWEQETLEMACMGEQNLRSVQEKNWPELFCLSISREQKQLMTIELPESMTTPRGKTFPLQYDPSGVVNIELKIQDAFGWKQTPKIAQGKIKLRLILLGPHWRPLQTTDDLESFWKGAYLEMRPALKARYPKHSWPENPFI